MVALALHLLLACRAVDEIVLAQLLDAQVVQRDLHSFSQVLQYEFALLATASECCKKYKAKKRKAKPKQKCARKRKADKKKRKEKKRKEKKRKEKKRKEKKKTIKTEKKSAYQNRPTSLCIFFRR